MEWLLYVLGVAVFGVILLLAWLTDVMKKAQRRDWYEDWYDEDEGL